MREALARHWHEYAIEAALLGCFMVSAFALGALLEHPASPARRAIESAGLRRFLMGLAMGGTAVGLICSPWGQRSGGHMNPATTLTFLRLGNVAPADAAGYMVARAPGGLLGVALSAAALGAWLGHPAVNYVATRPRPVGAAVAFAAEAVIAGLLMLVVLTVSNAPRWNRLTGLCAGGLVATHIAVEAPLSGMSMNPARSLGSAAVAGDWTALWIYMVAPPLGMLLGSAVHQGLSGSVLCAKLHHDNPQPCIFRCGWGAAVAPPTVLAARAPGKLRAAGLALVLALGALPPGTAAAGDPLVAAVDSVGITVSDMDRSVDFYTRVLAFEKVSDVEVAGDAWERLQGVFGACMRVVRLRLGGEVVGLTEYLAPRGRPVPADSRSQDRWFQHVAIVVSDMERAYAHLRRHRVTHASTGPQRSSSPRNE